MVLTNPSGTKMQQTNKYETIVLLCIIGEQRNTGAKLMSDNAPIGEQIGELYFVC
jgi:hypothetical protein